MKAQYAKRLLGCSYTTLHNYVKNGKLRLTKNSGKQQDYDEQSVLDLFNAQRSSANTIHVFLDGAAQNFKLPKDSILKILSAINNELASIN